MLPLDWHRALLLFLLIAAHVLLGVLAVIFYRRRLYREFPCFFAYALYEIAKFIPLFVLYSIPGAVKQYAYAFSATLLFSIALRFGVIDEVAKDLFRESKFLRVAARRALQCVTGLLLVMGILLAVYAPSENNSRLLAGIIVVNRGAAMVQCGLLLSLLLFSRFLGLSWRRPAFGITLGLGVLTSVDLAIYAVRVGFSIKVGTEFLNLLTIGTYLICVLIWIGYSLSPEPEPAISLTALPNDEVETWNREFQQLLRQ
jgi:hypothetical protein